MVVAPSSSASTPFCRPWKLVIMWWRCSWEQTPTAWAWGRGKLCPKELAVCVSTADEREGRQSLQRIWRWLLPCRCPQKRKVPSSCSSSPKIAPRLVPLTLQNGGGGCSENAHGVSNPWALSVTLIASLLLSLLSVSSLPVPPTCLLGFLTGLALNLTVVLVTHSIQNELSSAQRSWMQRFWCCDVSFWRMSLVFHW